MTTGRLKSWIPVLAGCLYGAVSAAEPPRDGDLIFHTSRSSQSLAIQRATHSPYCHVGVILHRDGKPYVFEAIATVRYTPLRQWIERGDRQSYVIRRLRNPLTDAQVRKLRAWACASGCASSIFRIRW